MNSRYIASTGLWLLLAAGWNCTLHAQDDLDDFRYQSPEPASPAPSKTGTAPPIAAPDDPNLIPAIIGLPPNPTQSTEYRIGADDLVTVEVFQVPELSSKERVDQGGNVILPLVGPIRIGGLTRKEAETRIAEELGREYLQNPQVNIFIEDYASQRVTVAGAVRTPGVFPLSGPTTLVQALAMAEGLTPVAEEEAVILFRQIENGQTQAYVIDVRRVFDGALTDPLMIGGDRIVVPESGTEVFFKGITDTLRGFVRPFGW